MGLSFRSRIGLVILAAAATTTAATSQTIPQLPPGVTPNQALEMAQRTPELGERLRQQLAQSGLSPDQIRSRLRAAGYSSSLLDAYLTQDSIIPPDPTLDMVNVISGLGLATFTTRDSLLFSGDTLALRLLADSLRVDSIIRSDSLTLALRGLQLFGLDVFRQPTTQFQPLVTGPVDDEYIVGPGDQLLLILTGAVQAAYPLTVTPGGIVVIPDVGQVAVNALSLGQVRDVLYARLGAVFSGVTREPDARTQFHITVTGVRVNTIRVAGEVNRPGSYQIAATGDALSAIYDAGGLKESANFRAVRVQRGSRTIGTIDLYDYLTRGETPTGIRLGSGDVVFVPIRGPRVKVAGEVKRPGIYELKPGEGLRELIDVAGGLNAEASVKTATLDRIRPADDRSESGRNRTVVTVVLEDALRPDSPGVPVSDGDSLTVFAIESLRRNTVTVSGSVWQPGTYELEGSMTFWDAILAAGGLRPSTYSGRAQIVRLQPDSTTQMLGIGLPTDGGEPAENPLLLESDAITVFSRADFVPQRYVAMRGAVREPGIVAFSDSMTLRDAVLLAGGVREDGYLVEAEVSRINPNPGNEMDSLAVVLRTALDESYIVQDDGYVHRPAGTAAPDVYLHPYDNVFIRQQPGWEVQRNVKITGMVRFPGAYTLLTEDERLSSLLDRAGGLRPQAYANGVRFFRSDGDAGRIGINLPGVLLDESHLDNIALAAGDSIHIPRFIPTVRVEGAVNSPASVTYVRSRDIRYYIEAAGGFSRQADKGGRFVQQPNGSIEKNGRPEPGAVVVVPSKDPEDRGIDVVTLITGITGILASLATVIVVVLSR